MGYWWGCAAQPAAKAGATISNWTYVPDAGAVPTAGKITKIQIYNSAPTTLKVAVFSKAGDWFTDEHYVSMSISNGYQEFVDGVDFDKDDLPIEVGEWIGHYNETGTIARDDAAGGGYWYDSGDQIGGLDASEFTENTDTREIQFRVWIETEGDKLSDDAESKLLAHIFKNTQYTQPSNIYIALCKSTIEDDDTGSTLPSEMSGGSYARKICNTWDTDSVVGEASNDIAIRFAKATGAWGIATDFAICDALTLGNIICYGKFATARNIGSGDQFIINTNDLDVTWD